MKKILMVTSVASMISQFNIPNIRLLIEMGYEVTVATNFTNPGNIPVESSKKLINELSSWGVISIDIPFARSPLKKDNINAFNMLEKTILDGNFDKIHCQTPIGGALTRFVKMKHKDINAEIIYTAHGFHFYKGAPLINWITYYPIEKLLSKYTDKLITINHEDYEISKTFYAKKCLYIPGVGIDSSKFLDSDDIKIDYLKTEFNFSEDSVVILSIGELNKNKNHEVVIKALSKLNNPNIHYLIAGKGILENYLVNLATEFNLNNQVHLLGFRNDIKNLIKFSHLFVFPSYREGLSVSVMEAMAMGKPVIASNIRGNNDLIDDGDGGYLFDPTDVDKLANLVSMLSKSQDALSKLGRYNSIKVKEYSLENILNALRDLYI